MGEITTAVPAPLTNPAVGAWTFDLLLTVAGEWLVRWEGSGNVAAVAELTIIAAPSEFLGDSLPRGELF
jgi:hypothetical protein